MDKLTEHHLRNLAAGNEVRNEDGSVSTVRTMQFDLADGRSIVIPSVWDGEIIEDGHAALARARKAGVYEIFDTRAAAEAFDKKIHNDNSVLGGRMVPMSAEKAAALLRSIQSRSVMRRAGTGAHN
jgi:hypothetical protein